jgi:hypothetical protein
MDNWQNIVVVPGKKKIGQEVMGESIPARESFEFEVARFR